ncbi:heterokaryon incompatibility protein-domain-containing protein [Bisporella sp. PMI_857]|nr:heterokaryon incompatibility protein-domain-containing protein [Bisporella sp. PMI_857]
MSNNTTLRNENDLYSVLPLGVDMIRVIDVYQKSILPSSTANTLSGHLRVLELSDEAKFIAVSYSWGSGGRDESPYSIQIYAFGSIVEISIPKTAYQAISDVRDNYNGQLTLWIDSVCINQNDNSEKELQIPLMRKIYSTAEIVYVHLGRTGSTDDAFDWMTHISQSGYLGEGIMGPGGAAEQSVDTRSTLTAITHSLYICLIVILIIPIAILAFLAAPIILLLEDKTEATDLDEQKLQSINSLLNLPWIQRAWTWQELVLARKAVIICGSKALAWNRFLLALSVVELGCQHSEKPSPGQDPTLDSMMGRLVVSSSAYKKVKKHFPENPNLRNLKSWCFLAECWLRVGRTWTIKNERAAKKMTFLDYHFKIYSRRTDIGISFNVFFLVASIVGMIVLEHFRLAGTTMAIGFSIHTVYLIGISLYLRKAMKAYCKLPMAFAIIPVLRTRKATDPRDICYGFYGVLHAEGLENLPSPNYQTDPRTVFRELFLHLIQWEKRALVLLLDCCNYEEPSWSPDWQEASRQSWLDEAYFFGNSTTSATPASEPCFEVTDNKLGLFVYGRQIGQAGVVWTGRDMIANDLTIADAEENADVNNLSILLEWIQTGLRHRSRRATGISHEDQVWIFEALEKEVTKTISARLFKLPNGFATWLRVIEPYVVGGETPRTEIAVQQDADISTARLEDSGSVVQCYERLLASEEALGYHRKICNSIAHQRRLFIHSGYGGFLFGAGSLPTRVDDIVCLISGLPVPMILRSAGVSRPFTQDRREGLAEAFLVIGPAFIPGMMKGEIWRRWNHRNNTGPLPRDRMRKFYLV